MNNINMTNSYIQTATQVFVSRDATLDDPNLIQLQGKSVIHPGVTLQGSIRMGRYCILGENTQCSSLIVPLWIRGHVSIGKNCIIHAASIGTNVVIGNDCQIGHRCIIKDNCWLAPGTILGDDTVIPPFSRVAGQPGQIVDELPPSAAIELQQLAQDEYQQFIASKLVMDGKSS